MKIAEIAKQARIQASGIVPDESRQSLPILVRKDGRVNVEFLFFPSVLEASGGTQMGPPQHRIQLDFSGKLIHIEAIDSNRLFQGHEPYRILGTFRMPAAWKAQDYLNRQTRLFELLDLLADDFLAEKFLTTGNQDRAELRKLFDELMEQPVKDYYHAFGKDFFNWLLKG